MPTKVFISWSSDLGRKLGEELRSWLPSALQYVKPYFTPEDITKGTKRDSEIAKELSHQTSKSSASRETTRRGHGYISKQAPLSKSIEKSRVCTLLFDLEPADVKGPLTSFQATRFSKVDFKKLIVTVNNAAGESRLEP